MQIKILLMFYLFKIQIINSTNNCPFYTSEKHEQFDVHSFSNVESTFTFNSSANEPQKFNYLDQPNGKKPLLLGDISEETKDETVVLESYISEADLCSLVFNNNNTVVQISVALISIMSLFRMCLEESLKFFFKKKDKINYNGRNIIKHTFEDIISIGLICCEENKRISNIINNTSNLAIFPISNEFSIIRKNKCTKKNKLKKKVSCVAVPNCMTSIEPLNRSKLYPLAKYNRKIEEFFNSFLLKKVLNRVLIAMIAVLYDLSEHYNTYLKVNFNEYLTAPPALNQSKVGYCTENYYLRCNPKFIVYWFFDWYIHLFPLNLENVGIVESIDLQPNSQLTKLIILIFCAIHNTTSINSAIKGKAFLLKWASNLSDLACKNEANYKYLNTFFNRIKHYGNDCTLYREVNVCNPNLLYFTNKPNYLKITEDVMSFFKWCHSIVHEALQNTVKDANK